MATEPPVEHTAVFASLRHDSFDQGVSIPEFQRRFEWDEEHYNRLWEDACGCAKKGRSHRHYLGPVVLTKAKDEQGRAQLVDGQQRFTVLSLIAIATRDVLRRIPTPLSIDHEDALNECLTFLRFNKDGEYERVLRFSHSLDDSAYGDLFNRPTSEEISAPIRSDSRLKKAHWHFYSQLQGTRGELGDTAFAKHCNGIAYACLHQLDCSPIYVRDEEVAYLVFEHINHQGKKLNQADLLKNLLLRLTPENRHECSANWLRFIDNTAGIPNVDPVTVAWYLWVAEHSPKTTKSSFYRDLRDEITGEDDAKKFSESLVTASSQISNWASRGLDARPSHLPDSSTKICPYALLQLFGYKTPYPVLLKAQAVRNTHGDSDYVCEHLADLLVRMLVRNKSICRKKCEEAITEAANQCLDDTKNESQRRVVTELQRRLSGLDAEDSTVTTELQGMRLADNSLPKGLLYLEFQANSPGASLHGSNQIDLEHVLPKSILDQSPQSISGHDWRTFQVRVNGSRKSVQGWLKADPDFMQSTVLGDLVYSLGNLALLTQKANRSIKDSDFASKRPYLSSHTQQNPHGSIVPTTVEIGNSVTDWTEQAIQQRANTLASKLLAGIPKVST